MQVIILKDILKWLENVDGKLHSIKSDTFEAQPGEHTF